MMPNYYHQHHPHYFRGGSGVERASFPESEEVERIRNGNRVGSPKRRRRTSTVAGAAAAAMSAKQERSYCGFDRLLGLLHQLSECDPTTAETNSRARLELLYEVRECLQARHGNKEAIHCHALGDQDCCADVRLCYELSRELRHHRHQQQRKQSQQRAQDHRLWADGVEGEKNEHKMNNASKVVGLICECLLMLWKDGEAPSELRSLSLVRLQDYIPWFVEAAWTLMMRNNYNGVVEEGEDADRDWHRVLKIIQLWAKIKNRPEIKSKLIRSGLLDRIREELLSSYSAAVAEPPSSSTPVFSKGGGVGSSNSNPDSDQNRRRRISEQQQALLLMGIIKDLSSRGTKDRDRVFLYRQLKCAVLDQCWLRSSSCDSSSEQQKLSISILKAALGVIWNLSVQPEICRSMGKDADVWRTLKEVCTNSPLLAASSSSNNDSNTADDVSVVKAAIFEIHRHLSAVVGTIVAERTMIRTLMRDGASADDDNEPPDVMLEQSSWLVPHLLCVLKSSSDPDTRRRCMRLIRCLAACEWGRQSFLWKVPRRDLIAVLVQVMRNSSSNSSSRIVDGPDTRSQACQTVSLLLPWAIDDWAPQLPCLETVLIQAIADPNTPDGLVLSSSHALLMSFNLSPWKRGPSCFTAQFFQHLFVVLKENISEPPFHVGISKLLLRIVQDGVAAGCGQQASTLLEGGMSVVLDTVALLMTSVGPDFESSRSNAIQIIGIFMDDTESKRPLAENDDLLSSLVNFCLVTSGSQKDKVKQMILLLVPEL